MTRGNFDLPVTIRQWNGAVVGPKNRRSRSKNMITRKCDVAIVGSGPAGLVAAIAAKENNAHSVLIIERDAYPGGILQQCIHAGFGLKYFNEELTGPEYAQRFIDKAAAVGVETLFNTTAIRIDQDVLVCVNTDGI